MVQLRRPRRKRTSSFTSAVFTNRTVASAGLSPRERRTLESLATSVPRSAGCSRSATIRTSCGSLGTVPAYVEETGRANF